MTNKENIVLKMLKKSLGLSLVLAGGAAAGTHLLSGQVSAQASAPKATKEERAVISQTLPNHKRSTYRFPGRVNKVVDETLRLKTIDS